MRKPLLNKGLRDIVLVRDREKSQTVLMAYLGWSSVPTGSRGFVPWAQGLLQCQLPLSLPGSSLD